MAGQNNDERYSSGLPTALLYLGIFGIIGCLGLLLFVVFTGGFFWLWGWACKMTGLARLLPSATARLCVGLLLYLPLLTLIGFKLRNSSGLTQRQARIARQKKEAHTP